MYWATYISLEQEEEMWNSSDGAELMKYLRMKCAQLWPFVFWPGGWDCRGNQKCVSQTSVRNWVLPVALHTSLDSAKRYFLLLLHQTSPKGSFPSSQNFACFRNRKSGAAIHRKWRKALWIRKILPKQHSFHKIRVQLYSPLDHDSPVTGISVNQKRQ